MFIPDTDTGSGFFSIPNPGYRGKKCTGPGSRIHNRNTEFKARFAWRNVPAVKLIPGFGHQTLSELSLEHEHGTPEHRMLNYK